jgi:hypothetical protein
MKSHQRHLLTRLVQRYKDDTEVCRGDKSDIKPSFQTLPLDTLVKQPIMYIANADPPYSSLIP